jgi:hypothetical protein|tara:strand:- start:1463 stop:1633 length:171 start_codon:yes stop_codon:yes gene_type:complete
MKKFTIKAEFLGKKVTGSVGVINLTEKTSQKDLNKLYKAGFNNIVEVVESNAKKED